MKKNAFVLLVCLTAALSSGAQMHAPYANPPQHDTTRPAVYIILNGGFSRPGSSYGWNQYDGYNTPTYHSGYASMGTVFPVLAGIELGKGWGFETMFSLYWHPFDANGFLHQNLGFTNEFYTTINNTPTYITINNGSAAGTYHYNLHSFLFGFKKDWGQYNVHIGIHFMAGVLNTTRPDIHASASISTFQPIPGNGTTENGYWNTDAYSENDFLFDIGIHWSVALNKHFFIRNSLDLQLSSFSEFGNLEFTDMSGNTLWEGNMKDIYGSSEVNSAFMSLVNVTLGVGYKF